jgi:membrane fusion protein, heavy metal efflux system
MTLRCLPLICLTLVLVGCTDRTAEPSQDAAEHHDHHDHHDHAHDAVEVGLDATTTIPRAIADEAGIRVAPASGGVIAETLDAPGQIIVLPGRSATVTARFPGVVTAVDVAVGDRVRAGQTLLHIDSNASLARYRVTSPISGTVLERLVDPGALAGTEPLLIVADLSTVGAELALFGAAANSVRRGMAVTVTRLSDGTSFDGAIGQLLPTADAESQALRARVDIDNASGLWRRGGAVEARITLRASPVALKLPLSAIQRSRDLPVAFIRRGDVYQIRPLTLGQSDGTWAEVKAGLNPGDEVVIAQSFLIKADLEKAGASHEH